MDFPTAMQAIIVGKKVRKVEWPKEMYVVLSGGFLKIFTADRKLHEWLVSEGDLTGDDYIIV